MILVTGATGLLGEALLRALHAHGVQKTRVFLMTGDDQDWDLEGLQIEKTFGDMRDPQSLLAACEGVEAVYHCAALISIVKGQWDDLYDTNVRGVENLIAAAAAKGVKRIVHVSSVEAMGNDGTGQIVTEEVGFRPDCAIIEYGRSKALGSMAMMRGCAEAGIPCVIVSPGGIIGPYDYKISPMGKMIWDCARRKLPGYVDGSFGFVDSRDVADLCILAMEKGEPYQQYIAVGEHYTVEQLMGRVEEISGAKRPIKLPLWLAYTSAFFVEIWHGLFGGEPVFTRGALDVIQTRLRFSSDKARALGWNPRSLVETIEDTHTWYAGQFGTGRAIAR